MGNVPLPTRDPLSYLEARLTGDRAMEPTLRSLARSMARRVRRETPDASVLTRALQAMSVQLFIRVQVTDPDAPVLLNASPVS